MCWAGLQGSDVADIATWNAATHDVLLSPPAAVLIADTKNKKCRMASLLFGLTGLCRP